MSERRHYRRRENTPVAAVQLALETEGFAYEKWGGTQRCRAGDWLVLNGDDTYTVAQATFDATYRKVSLGVYARAADAWAAVAETSGTVVTEEGSTAYVAGDYLIAYSSDGEWAYAIPAEKFPTLYQPA